MTKINKSMEKKTAKIEFKVEEKLLKKYKLLCERTGHTMSKRLRTFIEKEIKEQEVQDLKLIENDITNYMQGVMFEFNTPEIRKTIKENVDKILEEYAKKGIIYNYFAKCDSENNTIPVVDNSIGVLDIYIEKNKEEGIVVNNVTISRTSSIIKGGFSEI